jgi:adenosylmethionine-8-amino-7-oxononanoate aminotransferase
MEAAIKLARQYFIETGQPNRKHIIARKQSYHGNTLGALAAGGNQWRRRQFEPLLVETSLISPCYAWRYQHEHESEEDLWSFVLPMNWKMKSYGLAQSRLWHFWLSLWLAQRQVRFALSRDI